MTSDPNVLGKAENIMVSTDGYVKVVDFGLAKLVDDGNAPLSAQEVTRDAASLPAPSGTCPLSRRRDCRSTTGSTFSRSDASSTRCLRAASPSRGRARSTRSTASCTTIPTRYRRPSASNCSGSSSGVW